MKFILALHALAAVASAASVNPVRHVVTMLQKMVADIEAEGKKEEKAYEKFMCYCEGNNDKLKEALETGAQEITQLKADIEAKSARKTQLEEELKEAKASREAANAAVASATAIRDKDRAAFEADNGDFVQNINALTNAIAALEKGMGSFLQTTAAAQLKQIVLKAANLDDDDRQSVVAFLSGGSSQSPFGDYAPASGEIVGILKQMKDEMTKDQGAGAEQEAEAERQFKELTAAKKAEIAAATEAIEKKSEEKGKLAVEIAEATGALSDKQKQLGDDQQFLANMGEMCATKKTEWEDRTKARNEELVALADTIKILNDDDALDIFKSQLKGPASSASFLQRSSSRNLRAEAGAILGTQKNVRVALISNLLKAGGQFDKVIALIDKLIAELATEQADDEAQIAYCTKEQDATADKITATKRHINELTTTSEKLKTERDEFADTIAKTEEAIKNLDEAVAEATEERKEDNAEFVANKGMNTAAMQLLEMARNRLYKFYQPNLYKPPPKRELTPEEQILMNSGNSDMIATQAPTMIAGTTQTLAPATLSFFLQLSLKNGAAPPPPPETWGEHKSHESSSGVIGLMDKLISDLKKDMKQADLDENTAQAEYTKLMDESKAKRAADSKVLADAQANKARAESELADTKSNLSLQNKELEAANELAASLHADCDFIQQNFDMRKQARADEKVALQQAKAVLSGASYGL